MGQLRFARAVRARFDVRGRGRRIVAATVAAIFAVAAVAVVQLLGVSSAGANAANPSPNTGGTATVNPDGSVSASIGGTWVWAGQDCAGRFGSGIAVDWWGISASATPTPNFSLTNASMVPGPAQKSTGTISPAGAIKIKQNGLFFHVAQEYADETVNSTSCTDTPANKGSTGPWTATATYPNLKDVPSQICVNIYDEHGQINKASNSANDYSPVNDNDNSIDTNDFDPTVGNGYCFALKIITQTIQGEIYKCVNGAPSTVTVPGTVAVPSANLSSANPLAASSVGAGTYTVNATVAAADFKFVACGQNGVTINGNSASQSVTVPSGAAGDGKFYVVPLVQTIQGEIFKCVNGAPSTTLVSGGTLAVPTANLNGANPLASTAVAAGTYTMNATAPSGFKFVACGQNGVTIPSNASASQSVVVPSGGPGDGKFYVVPLTQTLQGEVYSCVNGAPSTTVITNATLAVPVAALTANDGTLGPEAVAADTYKMNATVPAAFKFVACGQNGVTITNDQAATQQVVVPSGGAGDGKFYAVPVSQTIQGEIYECINGAPSTTLISGGTVAVPSAALSSLNPLSAAQVATGSYTVNATAPATQMFVACGQNGVTVNNPQSATQSVNVPNGGQGDAKFYVVPVAQTIQGIIYKCVNGQPTTVEVDGGTIAVPAANLSSANQLVATTVPAGTYTMNGTAPSGYTFTSCGSTVNIGNPPTTANQQVVVAPGGVGKGVFYVVPVPQTIQSVIYACVNGVQTTTVVPGGTIAVSPGNLASGSQLDPTNVNAGTYTVTATAPNGQTFVDCGQNGVTITPPTASQTVVVPPGGSGTGTFYVQPLVTPTPPSFSNDVCAGIGTSTGATYTIPKTTGVDYLVGGVLTAAGNYPATDGQTVVVTAVAQSGYTLNGTTTFTHTFPAAPSCPSNVTPKAPTFVDTSCSGGVPTSSSYTIPKTVGVDYYVAGVLTAAGDYTATDGTTITVTTKPQAGYTLDGTTTFTHDFAPTSDCAAAVAAGKPSFADDVCENGAPTGASYTIPSTQGIVYSVNGAVVSAGKHTATDGTTVTVKATAKAGFELAGAVVFKHTFGAQPICSNTGGVSISQPPAPAFTGVRVNSILATGLALILLGLACCAGALAVGRRRTA